MWRALVVGLGASALTAGGLVPAGAASAQPSQPAPACGAPAEWIGKLCYFKGRNYTGAQAGFIDTEPDLLYPIRWTYGAGGAQGRGEQVANNAMSAHNREMRCSATIYYWENYNAGHAGAPSVTIGRNNSLPDLGPLNNDNRSHAFVGCS
jgi:hypothetical protein